MISKLRDLQLKQSDYDLILWRQKSLFKSSDTSAAKVIPLEEAPPSTPTVIKKPFGRPVKRLSDGTCKNTANKAIDEMVDSIAANAEFHSIDPFVLLNVVSQRCRVKWKDSAISVFLLMTNTSFRSLMLVQ